jgi:hypothetical protein
LEQVTDCHDLDAAAVLILFEVRRASLQVYTAGYEKAIFSAGDVALFHPL